MASHRRGSIQRATALAATTAPFGIADLQQCSSLQHWQLAHVLRGDVTFAARGAKRLRYAAVRHPVHFRSNAK